MKKAKITWIFVGVVVPNDPLLNSHNDYYFVLSVIEMCTLIKYN